MKTLHNTSINLIVLLLQFHSTYLSLSRTKTEKDVITSEELCPDPIIKPNSWNFINKLTISLAAPLFDDSGQSHEPCYYEPKSQIYGKIPEYSVTIRYITLSINPWSRNNNVPCKSFLQIDEDEKHCPMVNRSHTNYLYEWDSLLKLHPNALHYSINQFTGFVAVFPKLKWPVTTYNYVQIYFSIFAHNLNAWRIQQYAIKKTDCDNYIPDYQLCADYSYILDPVKNFSSTYKNYELTTMENDIIGPTSICPAFFSTSPKHSFENKGQGSYKTVYYVSSNSCTFEGDEDGNGHKDIVILKGIYASVPLSWNTFSGQVSQCPDFIQFSSRNISYDYEKQTKLCELPETTVGNIEYNPSIWITRHGELGFSYATFPTENIRSYNEVNMFYIYFIHKTKSECFLRIQKYERKCQNEDFREYCRAYDDCSNEHYVWSTIILGNIQHQYSNDEYTLDRQHFGEISLRLVLFFSFLSGLLFLSLAVICWYFPSKRRLSETQLPANRDAISMTSIRRLPLVGRNPTGYNINSNQTFPNSNGVAEETVFSIAPAINYGLQFYTSAENPPPNEICNDGLPTYSEATS